MARSSTPSTPQSAQLNVEQIRTGIRRLEKRLEQVKAFDPSSLDEIDPSSTVRPLSTAIDTALTETFGHETIEYNRFRLATRYDWPIYAGSRGNYREKVVSVSKARERSIQLLEAAIELLNDRLESAGDAAHHSAVTNVAPSDVVMNRVFIVHGRDEGPREAVARFISQLGFEPVILHEQANRGRTIIAKFRDEAATVGFAVVLITPDDEVVPGDPTMNRARQNVIFELGFFIGALGPDRVAAIVKQPVDTPSDYDGVVYVPYDGGWKVALAKEMQAAGYKIEWNVVMGG